MRLQGRTVVVTGGSGGIGRAVVRGLGAAGARVGMIGRDVGRLAEAVAEVSEGAFAVADVRRRPEVEAAVAELSARLGPPQALVAAHGRGAFGPGSDAAPDVAEDLLAVNFLGTLYAVWAVLPHLRDAGEGAIVLVGSVAGRSAAPYESLYSASKAALSGFADALAAELEGTGIRVSLVQPGPVATEFFARRGTPYGLPWPRPVPPETVAQVVLQALRSGAPELFVPPSLGLASRLGALFPGLRRAGLRGVVRRLEEAGLAARRAR